jgi:hypothetical protein
MRKKIKITIDDGGRDNGKVFIITEMSAARAEKWGMRAVMALSNSGANLPDDAHLGGMASIAAVGLEALTRLRFSDAEELLDEMMACIAIQPDPQYETTRPLIDDDTEEIATRLRLRKEVLELHLGFSLAGIFSNQTQSKKSPASKTTKTSRARSAR